MISTTTIFIKDNMLAVFEKVCSISIVSGNEVFPHESDVPAFWR